jgi:hypothetical protein
MLKVEIEIENKNGLDWKNKKKNTIIVNNILWERVQ